jgi:LPS-assembly lipoprotein
MKTVASPAFGKAALALAACLALSGCGFHLRGSEGDKTFEQQLYIEGPGAGGTFLGVFGSTLTGVGGSVVGAPVNATAVLRLYKAVYLRQPITLSRTGRATGYDLIYRVVYDVRSPKGEILQGRKEFEAKREYFNDQTLPLAQLAEEGQIREELEKEAAQSLLRRVVNVLRRVPDNTQAAPEPKL